MKKFVKSSKLNNHLICFDTETGGSDPYSCEPLEISAIVFDINTLEEKENGRFSALVKPDNWDIVSDEALKVNKLTREELSLARDQETVIREFVNFCKQFQKNDKSSWECLMPCGFNINGFDLIIMDRMCKKYDILDGKGRQKLFHPFHKFDLADIIRPFFYNNDELSSYSLDNVCNYFGYKRETSHRAMVDVEATWSILKRFLVLYKGLSPKYMDKFKNCFAKDKDESSNN